MSKTHSEKSAWQKRKEYSQKLRLATPSAIRKKRVSPNKPSVKLDNKKSTVVKGHLAKIESRKLIQAQSIKPRVLRNESVPKNRQNTTTKQINPETSQQLQKRKVQVPVLNSGNVEQRTTSKAKAAMSTNALPKTNVRNGISMPKKIAVASKPVPKQQAFLANKKTTQSLRNVPAVVSKNGFQKSDFQRTTRSVTTNEPLSRFGDNLGNTKVSNIKRIRRQSFTISSGKENQRIKVKPAPKTQNQLIVNYPEVKLPAKRRLGAYERPSPIIVKRKQKAAKSVLRRGILAEKKNETAENSEAVQNIAAKVFSKEVGVGSVKKVPTRRGTPLVRLPIRERLAMWRDRRETAEIEDSKRRKTLPTLTDVLKASRHEGCFVPIDATYSCPYVKKDRSTKRKKVTENSGLPVNECGSICDEEKENSQPGNSENLNEVLMDLEALIFKDSSTNAVEKKLRELKGSVMDIDNNAHYWKVLALITEKNGDAHGAMRIYEAAAENGAEPIEVITEAVEKFVSRLDEAKKTPSKELASSKKENGARSKRKKNATLSPRNIFESTLIQYAMKNYPSFLNELNQLWNCGTPVSDNGAIPLRRSARLSKSARKVAG